MAYKIRPATSLSKSNMCLKSNNSNQSKVKIEAARLKNHSSKFDFRIKNDVYHL
jgi:hypothetical protein